MTEKGYLPAGLVPAACGSGGVGLPAIRDQCLSDRLRFWLGRKMYEMPRTRFRTDEMIRTVVKLRSCFRGPKNVVSSLAECGK